MKLSKQGILITGASRGLGEALAHELASRGARLVLVARGQDALERVAAEIRASGGEAHTLVADVADKDAVHPVAAAAAAELGDVDVVIHNAGTLGPKRLELLADTACEDLQHALEVNVLGPFRLTKALVGPMLVRGKGVVAHITSDAAVEAYPEWGAYGASKAALDHLSRTWAAELDGSGVSFLALDPGEMDTAMHRAAMPDADRSELAQPGAIAKRVADVLEASEVASGARVEVA